jgi:hypothetical protein
MNPPAPPFEVPPPLDVPPLDVPPVAALDVPPLDVPPVCEPGVVVALSVDVHAGATDKRAASAAALSA